MEAIKDVFGRWAVPFVVGAIAGMILLATVGGFDGNAAVSERVDEAVDDTQDAFAEVLIPLLADQCVQRAQSEPDKLAEITALSGFQQRRQIADTGWVTYPEGASASVTREIDQACADALAE